MRRVSWLIVAVLTLASSALLVQPSKAEHTSEHLPSTSPTGWATPNESVRARVSDTGGSGIDAEASYLRLDGERLPTVFADGFLVAEARGMAEGEHEAAAVVFDRAGNMALATWTFQVDGDAPWIEQAQQSPTGTISDRTPLISVPASDALSGIRADAAHVTIARRNTLQVLSSTFFGHYDEEAGLVSYQVPDVPNAAAQIGGGPLPDGVYDVIVSVNDRAGWTSLTTWTFTVATLPVEVPLGY